MLITTMTNGGTHKSSDSKQAAAKKDGAAKAGKPADKRAQGKN